MKHQNRVALGFLLLALATAGRVLLTVPDGPSMAEASLTALCLVGGLLLAFSLEKVWYVLFPMAGQLVLELILCGTGADGGGESWRWLFPILRSIDLWLLLAGVWLVLGLGQRLLEEQGGDKDFAARFALSRRRMPLAAGVLLAVETAAQFAHVVSPANTAITQARSLSFLVYSVLLLWYVILLIRLYNALRVKK